MGSFEHFNGHSDPIKTGHLSDKLSTKDSPIDLAGVMERPARLPPGTLTYKE